MRNPEPVLDVTALPVGGMTTVDWMPPSSHVVPASVNVLVPVGFDGFSRDATVSAVNTLGC